MLSVLNTKFRNIAKLLTKRRVFSLLVFIGIIISLSFFTTSFQKEGLTNNNGENSSQYLIQNFKTRVALAAPDAASPNAPATSLDEKDPSGSTWWDWLLWVPKKIGSFMLRALLTVVYFILWIVYCLAYSLVWISEWLLRLVLDPQFVKDLGGFTTASFVKKTAAIVANLCNIFYMVILLFIAIGTMFGITNTSRLLVKLVIAAILTNFGLVIAGVIIDLSQVIMYSIISTDSASSNSMYTLGTSILTNLQSGMDSGKIGSITDLWFQDLNTTITKTLSIAELIIFCFVLVATLLTIAVILLIRIAMLWIILILSPIAFLFSILPSTEKFWNQWLENLTHYAFAGPILVFFIWLANKVSQQIDVKKEIFNRYQNAAMAGVDTNSLQNSFYILVLNNASIVFQLIFLVIILWAGIIIARQWGIKGAVSVDNLIDRSKGAGLFLAQLPSRAGRVTNFGILAYKGRKERKAEEYRQKGSVASISGNKIEAKKMYDKEKIAKKRIEQSTNLRRKVVRTTSAMSPLMVKKELAHMWKDSTKDYFEDAEKALKEFGTYWTNKLTRRNNDVYKKAGLSAEWKVYNSDKDLKEKHKTLVLKNIAINKERDPKKQQVLKNERDQIYKDMQSVVGSISEATGEDDKEKKAIKDAINNKFSLRASRDLPQDFSFIDIGRTVTKPLPEKARIKGEKDRYEFVKSFSLAELEEKEKAVEEQSKLIDKMRLSFDQVKDMLERGEGSMAMQTALLRKLSGSGKFFGDFMSDTIKEFQTRTDALSNLKERFSEAELIRALRTSDEEARKSKNLYQVGNVTYDRTKGDIRVSDDDEKLNLVSKYVSGLDPRDINNINPQSFNDDKIRELLWGRTDWDYLSRNNTFMRNIKPVIHENFTKYKDDIEKSINKISDSVERNKQKVGFTHVLEKRVQENEQQQPRGRQQRQQSETVLYDEHNRPIIR